MEWTRFLSVLILAILCRAEDDYLLSRSKREDEQQPVSSQPSTDLSDQTFIIVTIDDNMPYLRPKPHVDMNVKFVDDRVEGFIPDLIAALASELGFKYKTRFVSDGTYGSCQSDKKNPNATVSCTGMVQEVRQGQADIAAAPIVVTKEREKHVDFVRAFQDVGLTVLVKKDEFTGSSDIFPIAFDIFRPLDGIVYALVTLLTLATGLLLWVMNRFNPYEWGGRHDMGLADKSASEHFNLPGSMWFAFTSLQWQGFERAPRSLASKTLTCFWFVFVTITLVTYTASLMNHLYWASTVHGVHPFKPPFRNVEELVMSGKYDYGAVKGGQSEKILKEYATGEMYDQMKEYWNSSGKDSFPNNISAALEKVNKGGYALFLESNQAKYYMNKRPCGITTVGDLLQPRSYALVVKQGFPHLDSLHIAMMELLESGEVARLEKKWWVDKGECWNITKAEEAAAAHTYFTLNNTPKRVGMANFWGALVLMCIGIVMSLIVGMAETLFYKYRGRYSPSNRPGGQQLTNQMDEDGGRI